MPTTSPTYTTSRPVFLSSAIFSMLPGWRLISIAFACNGISERVKASPAGLKSSVFVSPGTLKTTASIFSGISGRDLNQLASAQLSSTDFACLLPSFANFATSLK